jgi:hypothetical protein
MARLVADSQECLVSLFGAFVGGFSARIRVDPPISGTLKSLTANGLIAAFVALNVANLITGIAEVLAFALDFRAFV